MPRRAKLKPMHAGAQCRQAGQSWQARSHGVESVVGVGRLHFVDLAEHERALARQIEPQAAVMAVLNLATVVLQPLPTAVLDVLAVVDLGCRTAGGGGAQG